MVVGFVSCFQFFFDFFFGVVYYLSVYSFGVLRVLGVVACRLPVCVFGFVCIGCFGFGFSFWCLCLLCVRLAGLF